VALRAGLEAVVKRKIPCLFWESNCVHTSKRRRVYWQDNCSQAVLHLSRLAARFLHQSRGSSCEICRRQSGIRTSFLLELPFPLPITSPCTIHLRLVQWAHLWGQQEGIQSHPTTRVKKGKVVPVLK
jgi:hypothetical protein